MKPLRFLLTLIFVLTLLAMFLGLLPALPVQAESLTRPLYANGDFVWAKSMGGGGADRGNKIAIDSNGNIYVMGYYEDIADFDPGVGLSHLTSAGENDIFVFKLDSTGNFIWAKSIGGVSYDYGNDIAVDSNGNIYIIGNFTETLDFDSGVGIANLTSAGFDDIFILKLDSNGNFVWAKSLGSTGYEYGNSIAIDSSGNIYIMGGFHGTMDFDPGAGIVNLTCIGSDDIFISKWNSGGNFIWAKRLGGSSFEYGSSLAVDLSGNVYSTGYIWAHAADFDPGAGVANLTSAGAQDIFVSKLSSNGNFIWAKSMGGTDYDNGTDISVDLYGNVYTLGNFETTGDFDPGQGTATMTSSGETDIFVSKLNSSGNFVWAKRIGGPSYDGGKSIITDSPNSKIYITGNFAENIDFDSSAGIADLTSAGEVDIFASGMDSSGNFIWAKDMGGVGYDYGTDIALDLNGFIYTTGVYEDIANFDLDTGTSLTSVGSGDIFVSRLSNNGVVSIVRANSNPTSAASIDFTVKFYKPVIGVGIDDFGLTTTGISGAAVSEVIDLSDNTYTVTVNTGNGDGTLRLDVVDDDTIVDQDLNPLGGVGSSNGNFNSGESYTIDRTEPTILSIARANSNPTASTSINFLVTFSEPVTNINKSDFSLVTTELLDASVNSISGTGATHIVKVNTGSGDGTIRLDALDNDTITDLAGNSLNGGFNGGEVYTVDKPDLPAPVLRSPRSNMTSNNVKPTLWWTAVKGAGSYEIEVASDTVFTSIEDNNTVNGVSYVVSTSLGNGIHYWRVRAYNASNQAGAWSAVRSFIIDTSGPSAPQLSFPLDAASSNRTPAFKWLKVSGAVLYEFQYDDDVNFADPLYTVTVRGTSRRPPAMNPGTYYWHVRAKDAPGNWGDWSTTWTINIINP